MKIAIVGCGAIVQVHAECIKKLTGHQLVAFCDTVIIRAQQFADKYHGTAYESYEDMIAKEDIDVLHICTPHYLHVPIAVYAIEHNLHVFMEKPPVISWDQFRQLRKLPSDRYLGFCFQNRYNPSIIEVKRLLESGVAGKINGGRGLVTWNRSKTYYTDSDWRGRLATEGGGTLINQSIHTLDLLTYLLGTPIAVDAVMANHHLKRIIEVEDMMEAYIQFEGGQGACFYATTAYVADMPPLIELSCENMTIRIEDMEVTYYYKDKSIKKPMIDNREAMGKDYWGAGHLDCITDFYHCIEDKKPFGLDLNHVRDTILLMLGTYESARTGEQVTLDNYLTMEVK